MDCKQNYIIYNFLFYFLVVWLTLSFSNAPSLTVEEGNPVVLTVEVTGPLTTQISATYVNNSCPTVFTVRTNLSQGYARKK
jgi:hypothetical protein